MIRSDSDAASDPVETRDDASEASYRAIFEQAGVGISEVALDGRYLTVNPKFCEITGYTRAEMLQLSHTQLTHPDDRDNSALAEILQGRLQSDSGEKRYVRKDRQVIWISVTISLVRDAAGRSSHLLMIAHEVTDRHFAQRALLLAKDVAEESELKLRKLIDAAIIAITTIDSDGAIADWNLQAERTFGWSSAEAVGLTLEETFLANVGRRSPLHRVSSCFRAGSGPVFDRRIETPATTRDGRTLFVELRITPIDLHDKRVYSLFIRDLTEIRKGEQDSVQLAAVVDASADSIMAHRLDGTIVSWNPGAEQIYGYSADDIIGQSVKLLIPDDRIEEFDSIVNMVTSDIPLRNFETLRRRNDGTMLTLSLSISALKDSAGMIIGAAVIGRDITEQRRLEKKVEQAERMSSLGRLAATVSHEFNNVLMGIQPYAEVIRRRGQADEQIFKAATQITGAVQRGKQITKDILKFTRAAEPEPQPVAVRGWFDSCADDFRVLAGDKVSVTITPPRESLTMFADPALMEQVMTNLVINARDAMPKGGQLVISAGPVSSDHAALLKEPSRYLAISVRDTGCGMTQETIRFIFEPLYTTKKSGGTGLGLAVVHQIISRHLGEILVESTLGEGTAFHLFLPLTEKTPAVSDCKSDVELPREHRLRKLVIVEDDQTIANGMASMLEMEGIEAVFTGRGLEAERTIETAEPEAVVLDLRLPDIDGVSVYRRIIRRWPHLPVLFSTGHGDEALLQEFLDLPNVHFLVKPFAVSTMVEELERLVFAS